MTRSVNLTTKSSCLKRKLFFLMLLRLPRSTLFPYTTLFRSRVTVANLKEISEKVKEGEGTIGALLADPTIYERLVTILEGAQRSFLLRSLIRGLGEKGAESKGDGPRR